MRNSRFFHYSQLSTQKRLLLLLGIVALIFSALFGRLFFVQIIEGGWLQSKATEQWTRDLPLIAQRGTIFDSAGNVLASSYTSYDVYVRASNVTDAAGVAKVLSEHLGLDYLNVFDKATRKGVSESLLQRQVQEDVALDIMSHNLAGIYFSQSSSRYYPYSDLLTQVLGYTTIDGLGQAGIEAYYNKFLKGINGSGMVESDIRGKELENSTTTYIPSVPGCDIVLTIDAGIQQILENTLSRIMINEKAKGASGIIINPKTGDILAMSNKPSFDLNNPPRDTITQLLDNTKNKNIVDVYEPGSTFKIFTTASALSDGAVKLDDRFYCNGSCMVGSEKIKCWRSLGHGSQDLVEGFANSCNCVFVNVGLREGKNNLYSHLADFGLGVKTGVDFSSESSGLLLDKSYVRDVDLARIAFGQAVAVTPLQLVAGVGSVLTGTLMQPRFVKEISTTNGIKQSFNPVSVRKVVSAEVSNDMRYLMEQVVSKSNGMYSFVPGYRIGGKTGTAQKYKDGKIDQGKYVSSFIGCYPAENPEMVMLICVDEPSAGAYYGGVVAAPYAKEIFSGIFNYKGIAPTNLTEDLARLEAKIEMPALVGMSVTDAVSLLASLKLSYEMDGEAGRVVGQVPAPGTMLFENALVVVKT